MQKDSTFIPWISISVFILSVSQTIILLFSLKIINYLGFSPLTMDYYRQVSFTNKWIEFFKWRNQNYPMALVFVFFTFISIKAHYFEETRKTPSLISGYLLKKFRNFMQVVFKNNFYANRFGISIIDRDKNFCSTSS